MLLRLSSLRATLRAYPSPQQKLSGGNSCEMLVAVVGLETTNHSSFFSEVRCLIRMVCYIRDADRLEMLDIYTMQLLHLAFRVMYIHSGGPLITLLE